MIPSFYRTVRLLEPGGRELYDHLKMLERSQWQTREQLENWQIGKIQKLIEYAGLRVPYYRNLFREMDIQPQDFRSFQDFQNLPFITSKELDQHPGELVTDDPEYSLQLNTTGGSTGTPMQFYAEPNFDMWDPALELRGRGWYGVRQGEKVFV